MNAYLEDFHSTLRTRYPVDGAAMSYSEWIATNTGDPKRPSKPYSFEGYEFQTAIADDMSRGLAVIKPSQVGLTEIQVRKALAFAARNRGVSVIFTLPNEKMFKRVSKTRIKPLITRERAFQSHLAGDKPLQSMDLYEMNGSFVYITGMTEGDATSIPADMLAHDEVDLSDQTMIGLFQSRLQNSSWKLTHKFSTPTFPNYGVDAVYTASDQKEWMCRCPACNHHQIPGYTTKHIAIPGYRGDEDLTKITEDMCDGLDLFEAYVKCERCSAKLDYTDPAIHQWVARHPGRRISGFRVRPFMTHSLSPEYVITQLWEYQRLEKLKGWYNTVLGAPYSDGSNQLTEAMVKACLGAPARPEVGSMVPIGVGIDVGIYCNVVWGPLRGGKVFPTHFELVHSDNLVEYVKKLDETQNIRAGCIDRLPYTPTANAVRDATRGKILPVQYAGGQSVLLKKDPFGEIDHAQINRTSCLDSVTGLIRRGELPMTGYLDQGDTIVAHCCDLVRIEEPEVEAHWEKITGADHWLHALGYLAIAPKVHDVVDNARGQEICTEIYIGGVGTNRRGVTEPALIGTGRNTYFRS